MGNTINSKNYSTNDKEIDHTSSISLVIYLSSVFVLIVLAFVSFLTGFKISFLPFKLCPVIFITSAVLIILGGLL